MDNLYQDALKRLKNIDDKKFEYFQDAIFANMSWDFTITDYEPTSPIQGEAVLEQAPVADEKSKILESLKDYYHTQTGQNKSEEKYDLNFKIQTKNKVEISKELINLFGQEYETQFFGENNFKVLFLTDEIVGNKNTKGDIFDFCFEEDVALLFRKMVGAMNLDQSEYRIIETNADDSFELSKHIIAQYRPQVVVTLGAKSISKVLDKKTRLNHVHGQRFSGSINDFSFDIFPIFHPAYLLFNQDMKKTTWNDLQKIMKRIGKI